MKIKSSVFLLLLLFFFYTLSFGVDLRPVAEAGDDQLVDNSVTLDGSQSTTPEGTIVSYEWTLAHREDSSNNQTTTGITPTVQGLSRGFYDVTLTVTNDYSQSDIDTMVVAASGDPCEDSFFVIPIAKKQ